MGKELHFTGTVTMVFTDIEGSSALWETYQNAFHPLLEAHNRLMRDLIAAHHGMEIRHQGDGFFLSFERASDAVEFSVATQRALAAREWRIENAPQPLSFKVRIGMHSGEAQAMYHPSGSPDYYGASVNRAARVGGAGHGGQIVVSEATRLLAAPLLSPDITFEDLGAHRLKGVGKEHLWQVGAPDLPREFAALATLEARRHNFPLPTTPFLGREGELAAWHTLLQEPATRLLTIMGFGGIGKTRAALQLAELCIDNFAEGVWWIDLAEARDGEAMIQRIASALNFFVQTPPTAREQVRSYLRGQQVLLVLDNLEQIPDAGEIVRDLLEHAPHLKIVATSRRALDLQAEHRVEVPSLPPAEAQLLFVERARARRADFTVNEDNREDVARLCRGLEGIPLAIELAASRLGALSPREIESRLNERLRLLHGRASDLLPRQRALRAVVDWSYDLLTTEERALFTALSTFAGGFALDDAEAICEAADVPADPLDGVLALRQHSLLRDTLDTATQRTRYSMLEAVREYATEKLSETPQPERAVRDAHARYFEARGRARTARLRTRDEPEALRAFETDLDNTIAALNWTRSQGQPLPAARLGLALGTFLWRCGFGAEATRRIEDALQLMALPVPPLQGEPDLLLRTELWRERGGLYLDDKDIAGAQRCVAEALRDAQAAHSAQSEAEARNLRGLIARAERNWSEARTEFEAALQVFESARDWTHAANVYNNLGVVEREAPDGTSDGVTRFWEAALRLRQEAGDRRGMSETLNNLGVQAMEQGQLDAAWRYGAEALHLKAELGHISGVGSTLYNLAEIAEAREDFKLATRLCAASEVLMGKVGSPYTSMVTTWLDDLAPRAGHTPKSLAALRHRLKEQTLPQLLAWALT